MFNSKNINLKLFLATIFAVSGIHGLDGSTANSNLIAVIDFNHQAIAIPVEQNSNFTLPDGELIAKKSGGRSGGGSFKSRSSGSKSRSGRSSSTRKKSSSSRRSNRRSYSPSYDSSPSYRRTPRRTYTNNRSRSYHSGQSSGLGKLFITLIILLLIGVPTFIVLFLVFKAISNRNSSNGDRRDREVNRERDNSKVTVSQLQVALSPQAEGLQQELSTLSLRVNTNTDQGLVELMRESVLILLRHDRAWTHVLANSNSWHISHAEEAFNKISVIERSKFSSESLSNVDGKIQTTDTVHYDGEDFPAYVVVTLIFGTADDNPLFGKIHTETQLKEVLLKLASMREDYLMKFELLWTPQQEDEYLTDDELLMEYTNMIKLV